jgi:hypothetical protein
MIVEDDCQEGWHMHDMGDTGTCQPEDSSDLALLAEDIPNEPIEDDTLAEEVPEEEEIEEEEPEVESESEEESSEDDCTFD